MKGIIQKIRIIRAVIQLLNVRNKVCGMVMIRTKKRFVGVAAGDLADIAATVTLATIKDPSGITKNAIQAAAKWMHDHENDNAEDTTEAKNVKRADAANEAAEQKEENAQE